MANYLVTGGAGFIGSNIVEELVRRGEKVKVLDNFLTGKKENLEPFMKKIELVEGDIRDRVVLMKAMAGIEYVIHQAALRSVAKSVEDPVATNDVNVFGTLNLLMAARENNTVNSTIETCGLIPCFLITHTHGITISGIVAKK